MKKILFAVLGVVILISAGLYFYISSMDWNKHKDKLVDQLMEATGKKVSFNGDLSFSIFPTPYLRAKEVKIYNENGGEPLAVIPSLVSELELVPLLHGDLKITKMSMEQPTIYITLQNNGKLNWQGNPKNKNYDDYSTSELSLNSAILEGAVVKIYDQIHDKNFNFENVMAEISAESINGPYRVEGNFDYNGQPLGFAFSVGQYSESFATSVNVAITHPASDSYIRFDGSAMPENNAFTGSIIMEAKQPQIFISKFLQRDDLSEEFNEPLTITTELKSNKVRVDLSNFVIKYGRNVGAGNILIPIEVKNPTTNKKIEALFEMTDLNLDMFVDYITKNLVDYKNKTKKFQFSTPYDFAIDLRSVKTFYRNYELEKFVASLDVLNNVVMVKNVSVTAPGNTKIAARGKASSEDDELRYNIDVGVATDDAQKMLSWLGMKPHVVTPSTYKNMQLGFTMSGSPTEIKISPLRVVLDKINLSGALAVVLAERNSAYITLDTAEAINFDNYINSLPDEYASKSIKDKIIYRFSELSMLNDIDLSLSLRLNGGILDKVAFGNTELIADITNGRMDIKTLRMSDVYDSIITLSGAVSGFGQEPVFDKLNYSLFTEKFQNLWKNIKFTDNFKNMLHADTLNVRGSLNGTPQKLEVRSILNIGGVDLTYDGLIDNTVQKTYFDGNIEIKAPNFSQFMDDVYPGKNNNLLPTSLLVFNSRIEGSKGDYKFKEFEAFLGANALRGNAEITTIDGRDKITADIDMSELNLNGLLLKNSDSEKSFVVSKQLSNVNFLNRIDPDKSIFDYGLFSYMDFEGNLKIGKLIYDDIIFDKFSGELKALDQKIDLKKFVLFYGNANISGDMTLDIKNKKEINGEIAFQGLPLEDFKLRGNKYGILSGVMSGKLTFASYAESMSVFVSKLKGILTADITDLVIRGWNANAIYEDLAERETSEKLLMFVRDNLQKGKTTFETAKIEMVFDENKFTLQNTSLSSPNYVFAMSGTGNLESWDMDISANITFPTLKEMSAIGLDISESMEDPKSRIDVKAIADKYDNYWQQLAEEKEQRKKLAEAKRREQLIEENKKLRSLIVELDEIVLPNLTGMENRVKAESSKQKYQDKYQKAQVIYNEIQTLLKLEEHNIITDEDLILVEGKYNHYTEMLDVLRKGMDEIYAEDMQKQYDDLYDKTLKVYSEAKIEVDSYRSQVTQRKNEGLKINPLFLIDKGEEFVRLRDAIEHDYMRIDNNYSRIINDYYNDSADMSLYQTEQSNLAIMKIVADSEEALAELKKNIRESVEYMKTQIEYLKNPELKAEEERKERELKAKEEEELLQKEAAQKEEIQSEADNAKEGDTASEQKADAPAEESKKFELKELQDVDAQSSKKSGIIRKAGQTEEKNKATKPEQSTPKYLKKISGSTGVVSGSIKKAE